MFSHRLLTTFTCFAVVFAAGCRSRPAGTEARFAAAEEAWRAARDVELKGPESWLTVAGLFWLDEGDNAFGSDPSNGIVLPSPAAARAGVLIMSAGGFSVRAEPGAGLTVNGAAVESAPIRDEGRGKPDVLGVGDLTFWIIKRDLRYAVRLRDPKAEPRRAFTRIEYYPASPEYRVEGEFRSLPKPTAVRVEAKIVGTAEMTAVGRITFSFRGRDYEVEAWEGETEGTVHLVLGDETNGRETYGGGRFLDAPLLDGGRVELNFNRLYNPPCVFSAYATCPLPPPQNRLPFRVEAGEKMYAGAGH